MKSGATMPELPSRFREQLRTLLPDEGYTITADEAMASVDHRPVGSSMTSLQRPTVRGRRIVGLKPAIAWMLALLVLGALGLGIGVGVGGSSRVEAPLTAQGSLDKAINAVLDASNFTLVITEKGTLGSAPLTTVLTTTVTSWVIEKPDRISMKGTPDTGEVIAIGSTRYSENQSGQWSAFVSKGVSTNFTNGALLYIRMLLRASSVAKEGSTYVVPGAAALNLLASTRLTLFQGIL